MLIKSMNFNKELFAYIKLKAFFDRIYYLSPTLRFKKLLKLEHYNMIDDKASFHKSMLKNNIVYDIGPIGYVVNKIYWKIINKIKVFYPDSYIVIWFNILHTIWALFLFYLFSIHICYQFDFNTIFQVNITKL